MTYSKIHDASPSSTSSALDVFAAPVTKTSVVDGTDIEIGPIGNPDASDIDFVFQTSGQNYLDARNTMLHVQCKVSKADGTTIGSVATQKIMPVTNFLHCLFTTVQVSYGNHNLEYANNYPYMAYLENLLNSGEGSKRSTDQAHMWIHDDTGVIDTDDIAAINATDILARKALIQDSKTIDLCGPINLSILLQERYLPPGAPLKIRLTRSAPEFCLVRTETDATTYKITFSKCDLNLRQVTIHPGVVTAHNALLSTGNPMLFPLNRVEVQTFAVSSGQQSVRLNAIVNRQKPKRMFVALVDHKAKNGDLDTDPFNFAHFGLKSIVLDVDGFPIPSKPIQTDFDSNIYTKAFYNLGKVAQKTKCDFDHGLARDMFARGYAIYAFDLTPDECNGDGVHLIRNQTVTIEATFKAALTQTVSVVVFSEFDELVQISEDRSVSRLSGI